MNHPIARIAGVLVALPSLAAAQGSVVAPAPTETIDAAGAATSDAATGGSAAASGEQEGVPNDGQGERTPPDASDKTAVSSAQSGAVRARPRAAPTPLRAGARPAHSAHTWRGSSASAGSDADAVPLRSELQFRLGGMPRIHAGVGTPVFRHRDPGFAVFTADEWTTGVTASAGVDVFRFGQRWFLSADADWWREVHRSVGLFGGFGESNFDAHTLGLGASLRYRALDWCQPYVHAWGGLAATRASLSVTSIQYESDNSRQNLPAFGAAFGVTAWGPVLGTQQGADYERLVSFGVRVEAGYELTGAFDFQYDLRGKGTYPIAVYEPSAGALRLDAPYVRLLVMLGAV